MMTSLAHAHAAPFGTFAAPGSAAAPTGYAPSAPSSAVPAVGRARSAYLHPGELLASASGCAVTTILGSCVAACVFDPGTGVGGLTHCVLPYAPAGTPQPARYGDRAVPELVRRLLAAGARRESLRALLFGGACVLEAFRGDGRHLGTQNVDAVREALRALGIPVIAENTGGPHGRRLHFQTGDGTALVLTL